MQVFALLPYKVEALEIEPRKKEVNAGEVAEFDISLKVSGEGMAKHVVRVEVSGPDGVLPHYGAQGVLEEGKWTYSLPTALNDAQGEYELCVTDVISGKEAVVKLEVR